jgi:flagellar hook assembly protein FlgD
MRYCDVRLDIFNQRGQLVRTLVHGQQAAGSHSVQWDGLDYNGQPVSSGVYLYHLQAEHQMLTRKLMLMK